MGITPGQHANTEPHFSTRFYIAVHRYLESHGFIGLFAQAAKECGLDEDYILVDSNWVSVSFADRFNKRLIELTEDPDLLRKVGTGILRPESVTVFEYSLIQLIGPAGFLFSFGPTNNKVSRVVRCSIVSWRPGKGRLRVRYLMKAPEHLCDNCHGMFEGMGVLWDLDSLSVNHDKCIRRGDKDCEWTINYSARKFWMRRIGLASVFAITGLLSGLGTYLGEFWRNPVAATAIGSIGGAAMAGTVFALIGLLRLFSFSRQYHAANLAKTAELHESHKKLDRRYQEANLLRELSLNLVRETNPTKLIDSVLTEIEKRFGYGRTMVMLVSPDQKRLYTADVRGFGKFSELIHKLQFAYPAERDHQQLFANILERGETTFIENMDEFIKGLKPENQVLLMALGINSMVVAPIQDASLKYGLMIVGETGDPKRLTQDDRHLMENIARLFSVYFQNARNFEKESTLRAIFQKYVPAVVLEGIQSLTTMSGTLLPKDNFITSFFIDLRDFTTKSEGMAPEKVVELLNHYFNFVSKHVSDEGGIVDNLIGDAMVAFFPAEEKRRTLHAGRAIRAAVQILAGLETFNTMLKAKGFAEIQVGIGIHTGKATVGSIGSEHKLNYTAIGDTVNVASRLQGLCKKMEGRTPAANRGVCVVSDQTFLRARIKTDFLWIGPQAVKGRKESVNSVLIDTAMATRALAADLPTWTDDEHEGIAEKLGIGVAGEPSIDRRAMKPPGEGTDDESGNQEAA